MTVKIHPYTLSRQFIELTICLRRTHLASNRRLNEMFYGATSGFQGIAGTQIGKH